MPKFNTLVGTGMIRPGTEDLLLEIGKEMSEIASACSETEIVIDRSPDGTFRIEGYGYMDFSGEAGGRLSGVLAKPMLVRGEDDGEPYYLVFGPDCPSRKMVVTRYEDAKGLIEGQWETVPDGPMILCDRHVRWESPVAKAVTILSDLIARVGAMTKTSVAGGAVFSGYGTSDGLSGAIVSFSLFVDEEGFPELRTGSIVNPFTWMPAFADADRAMDDVIRFAAIEREGAGLAPMWGWPGKDEWTTLFREALFHGLTARDMARRLVHGGRR